MVISFLLACSIDDILNYKLNLDLDFNRDIEVIAIVNKKAIVKVDKKRVIVKKGDKIGGCKVLEIKKDLLLKCKNRIIKKSVE
jgi:hypothetical protein